MVKITPLKAYLPKNPKEFCTNPYDIIGKEEEQQLKKNPHSLIHLILPDGEGDEIYQNAAKAYNKFKEDNIIVRDDVPSIFVYRQESPQFSHQGLILGISLKDYEEENIVKHEHTREKPLRDRTKHITTTNVTAGLVWSVFQANKEINDLIEQIKQKEPLFDFQKYGYRHLLWRERDTTIINQLKELFKDRKVYIADGHHRAASAAEYYKLKIKDFESIEGFDAPWLYLLSYVASDDQIQILPYNRVIRNLKIGKMEFLKKLEEIFEVDAVENAFNPEKKNQIALCIKGDWYRLSVKDINFSSKSESLDVTIIQDKVLEPILGISDPRADEDLFFIGGIRDPIEMEKYTTEKENDLFFNLYPVDIRDLEAIADEGGVMPPKSTWFNPKVLSGLILHGLTEE